MKNTITFCTKSIQSVAVFSVIAMGVFVVLPILSLQNHATISTATVFADEFDYGFGGAEIFGNGCCEETYVPTAFDYGVGGAAIFNSENTYVPTAFDYGVGGATIIENGCCEPVTAGSFDYGVGGATIIENGCCEPVTTVAFATPSETTEIYIEQTVREYGYGISGGYYGGYGGGYGGSYSYGFPTASYGNYAYSYPSYSYGSPTYTPTTFTQSPSPTCSLTVSDNEVDEDDEVTLRWTTTNATAVSIGSDVGTVGTSGSREVTVDDTTNFVLVASGQGGTVWCSELVTVDEDDNDDDDDSNVQCDSFRSSDDEVEDGDRITLTWRTTGADSVRINEGIGSVSDDGDRSVRITSDTTFILTARDGNDTDTCRVTVEVEDEDDDENPRCRLTISDRTPSVGERVTLSWENERTDRLTVRDNRGNTIADSRNDRNLDEDRDSIVVTPRVSTEYTLTAYNGSETRTCRVSAEVNGVVVTSVRSQDTIALSSVPYTGFEAGTVLTIIFYSAIVLWGIGIAYLLLRRKKVGATDHSGYAAYAIMPEVSVHEEVAPSNLPTEDVITDAVVAQGSDDITALEVYAHDHGALISSDALRFIASEGNGDALALLDRVIGLAKARFPRENDWVVINKERVLTLLG